MSYTDGTNERSAFRLNFAAVNLVVIPCIGLPLLAVVFMATGICGGACNQMSGIRTALGIIAAVLAALFFWTLIAVRRRWVPGGLVAVLCILDVPALLLLLLVVRHILL